MTKGLMRTFTHPVGSINSVLRSAQDFVQYLASDPARAIGTVYLAGDLMYSQASKGAVAKDFSDRLKDISGNMAVAQSLIYMYYARDTGEKAVGQLDKAIDRALKSDMDPLEKENWNTNGFLPWPISKADNFMKRYPIETGAWTQMIGQVGGMMTAGGMNVNKAYTDHPKHSEERASLRASGGLEMGRGAMSALAWSLLMQEEKQFTEEEKKNVNVVQNAWQLIQSYPQRAASVLNLGASVLGLAASKENRNPVQKAAEITYLVGDGIMFVMKKSDYGSDKSAVELASKASAKLVSNSNLVFGPEEEAKFVEELSEYISRRVVEDTTYEDQYKSQEEFLQVRENKAMAMKPKLAAAITRELSGQARNLRPIAHEAASIASYFPDGKRDEVIDVLSETLAKTKAVYVKKDEFKQIINEECMKICSRFENVMEQPTMNAIADPISNLIFALPGYDSGATATRLYNALQPFVQQQRFSDKMTLEKSMQAKAKELPA
jgi:hypothetical protein